jgi:hypothetical protein
VKRGVVLQVGASEVVVLTPDGQFCRVRREPGRAYIVGEEICFFLRNRVAAPNGWVPWVWWQWLLVWRWWWPAGCFG